MADDFILSSEQAVSAPPADNTPAASAPADVQQAAPAPADDPAAPATASPDSVPPLAPPDPPAEQSRRQSARFAELRRANDALLAENARLRQGGMPAPPAPETPPYAPDDAAQYRDMVRQETRAALQEMAQQSEAERVHQAFLGQEEAARQTYPDYDAVVDSLNVPFADAVLDAIKRDEAAAHLSYYLGSHQEVAERISRMPPAIGLVAIGRLAANLPGITQPHGSTGGGAPTPPNGAQPVAPPPAARAPLPPLPPPPTPIQGASGSYATKDPSTMDYDTEWNQWYVQQFGSR